jgi:hypothetical protein
MTSRGVLVARHPHGMRAVEAVASRWPLERVTRLPPFSV